MKHILPLLLGLFLGMLSLTGTSHAASEQTVTLDVPGMTCAFCPVTIRKALKKVDGVIEAKASYDTKTATVTFDPSKTSVEQLTQVTAEVGYPSTLKQ